LMYLSSLRVSSDKCLGRYEARLWAMCIY